MNQNYVEGFIKRAADYGLDRNTAIIILKKASAMDDAADISKRMKETDHGKDTGDFSSGISDLERQANEMAITAGIIPGAAIGGLGGSLLGAYIGHDKDEKKSHPWLGSLLGLGVGAPVGAVAGGVGGGLLEKYLANKALST